MYKLQLLIPRLPKSLNATLRQHYFRNHAQNNLWDILIKTYSVSKLPKKPLVKARISIVRHFHRTLDYDGLVGSLKPVVDSLVSAGVICDDRWNVVGAWTVDQKFRPRKEGPLLEICVEEIV